MVSKLSSYWKKRNFKETPEPKGSKSSTVKKSIKTAKSPKPTKRTSTQIFVVQLHKASHLHYDFRLKIGNVLKSWAVPKGPSMNPKDKRLAVPTEDHPLEYANFQGVIPPGHYGAGSVKIWDKGTFINYTVKQSNQKTIDKVLSLKKAYENGHIIVELKGSKLKGKFVLQQFRQGEKPAWMLIKMKDEYAKTTGKRPTRGPAP